MADTKLNIASDILPYRPTGSEDVTIDLGAAGENENDQSKYYDNLYVKNIHNANPQVVKQTAEPSSEETLVWIMAGDGDDNTSTSVDAIDQSSLFIMPGDTVAFRYFGAGYVTSSGYDVNFTIYPNKIIHSSVKSATKSTFGGWQLRQGNTYCYGSSASVAVNPDKYSATILPGGGIRIAATMENTTNVTNNSPIGICVGTDMKITFA